MNSSSKSVSVNDLVSIDRIYSYMISFMHRFINKILCILLTLFAVNPAIASAQMADKKSSPFEALRWNGDSPEVMVKSTWYRPIVINGVDIEEVLSYCKKQYGSRAQKRFGEDLPVVLQGMGHPLPATVDLKLVRLDDGVEVTLFKVPSTRSNRKAIWQSNQESAVSLQRQTSGRISREEALADLAEFEIRLDDQFSYRHLRGIDLPSELEKIYSTFGDQVEINDLAWQLHILMMKFGDGHAGVRSRYMKQPSQYPPFLLEQTNNGVIAFTSDRKRFLDSDRPYLLAIDGYPIDELIEAVQPQIAAGSTQLVRARALRELRNFELIRKVILKQADRPTVTCTLASGVSDSNPVDVEFYMSSDRPIYGHWPRNKSRVTEENIGYLRIEEMDDQLIPHIETSMNAFRNTDGLIVDVRSNGGGTRLPLIVLASYLLGPDDEPWVGNVGRYRLSERFGQDHLEARYMYRANDSRWTDSQRLAIKSLGDEFKPEWDHAEGFSEWHYLVLDRIELIKSYFYDKPVVILSNANCFSATDIFLGALAGRPRVTLMGGPSGGGSARSQRFKLPNSGIEISCASMASFRPDGRLYDGRGIDVDVEIESEPLDFLYSGQDRVLGAAIEHIQSHNAK